GVGWDHPAADRPQHGELCIGGRTPPPPAPHTHHLVGPPLEPTPDPPVGGRTVWPGPLHAAPSAGAGPLAGELRTPRGGGESRAARCRPGAPGPARSPAERSGC